MESKEELKRLIESVVLRTGKTQEQIAKSMGYGGNYISDILSPTGKVTKKFVNALKGKYQQGSENTNYDPQTPPELITALLRQQNNLMGILTDVIKGQKEAVVDKVQEIDTNLKAVSGQAESLKFDLVSGRATILRSLSRLDGKPVEFLLKEADNMRISLAEAKAESYRKAAKRRIGNTGS